MQNQEKKIFFKPKIVIKPNITKTIHNPIFQQTLQQQQRLQQQPIENDETNFTFKARLIVILLSCYFIWLLTWFIPSMNQKRYLMLAIKKWRGVFIDPQLDYEYPIYKWFYIWLALVMVIIIHIVIIVQSNPSALIITFAIDLIGTLICLAIVYMFLNILWVDFIHWTIITILTLLHYYDMKQLELQRSMMRQPFLQIPKQQQSTEMTTTLSTQPNVSEISDNDVSISSSNSKVIIK